MKGWKRVVLVGCWLVIGGLLMRYARDLYVGAVFHGAHPGLFSGSLRLYALMALMGVIMGLWGAKLLTFVFQWAAAIQTRVQRFIARTPLFYRYAVTFLLMIFPTLVFFNPWRTFETYTVYVVIVSYVLTALLATVLVFPQETRVERNLFVFFAFMAVGGALFITGKYLYYVRDYPLMLGWSEGNRFWDYSLMFGADRYAVPDDQPLSGFISPGRQFLWGVVFLLPRLGIWGMRLWNALLWTALPFAFGWLAVARQLEQKGARWLVLLFGAWTLAFVEQGPIYGTLLISAMLVVFAVRVRSLPIGMLLVMAATWYANISRWTWSFAPGLWAGMIALLEVEDPVLSFKEWKKLVRPALLGLSGLAAIGLASYVESLGQTAAVVEEAVVEEGVQLSIRSIISSIQAQPLIWSRLLPSPTYSFGVLFGSLYAGLPLAALVAYAWLKKYWRVNRFQIISMGIISGMFWLVGLVISTKIGGGSNLHNLDMLWITLVLIGATCVIQLQSKWMDLLRADRIFFALFLLTLLMPSVYSFLRVPGRMDLPGEQAVDELIHRLQTEVDRIAGEEGEVLFIDQRQLLTFGEISNVEMVSDYEKKLLMENAMRGNQAYFDLFYDDIFSQHYDLIVTEPLVVNYQESGDFDAENNAWVRFISHPVLCYYRDIDTNTALGVQLLVPREAPLQVLDGEPCPRPITTEP
ncbi:MAG: hypothetical protein JW750_03975 [Anaerolineaceae bacterium]|nr:hypothetical protein [Anaerolineaceae bacterium]